MAVTSEVAVVAGPASIVPPRSVQWGAVVLGALAASAISMVLLSFGAGIGLSITSAQPYAGASAKALAVISTLFAAVSLVASFAAGGYIAGRMRLPPSAHEVDEADFRDGAHGLGVWALAVVVSGLFAASGIVGTVKTAVQATATGAATGAASAAANPAGPVGIAPISMTPADYATDRLLAPAPTGAAAGATRADLNATISRSFAASARSGDLAARDRATLVAIVMQQTGLPQAEAEKRVDDAYADFKTAEQKARDAADKARKAALIAAFGVAATLLLGCAAACAGATAGARHRRERTAIAMFGNRRFW